MTPAEVIELAYTQAKRNGSDYYAILAELAAIIDPKIAIDIGTEIGKSANAMALHCDMVHTFDISSSALGNLAENVIFHEADLTVQGDSYSPLIASAPLVFIDVAPHDGIKEVALVDTVRRAGRSNLFIAFDDIGLNEGMRDFWANLAADIKMVAPDWAHPGAGWGVAYFS